MNILNNYPEEMIPQGIGSLAPCVSPDTFICVVRLGGLAKLTIKRDSKNAHLELLGINPLESEQYGDGPHSQFETWNDGKVSPDGKFFAGTVDNQRVFGYDNSDVMQHYWTMNGNN